MILSIYFVLRLRVHIKMKMSNVLQLQNASLTFCSLQTLAPILITTATRAAPSRGREFLLNDFLNVSQAGAVNFISKPMK